MSQQLQFGVNLHNKETKVPAISYLENVAAADGRKGAEPFPDLLALFLAPRPPSPGRVDVVDVDLQRVQVDVVFQAEVGPADQAGADQVAVGLPDSLN